MERDFNEKDLSAIEVQPEWHQYPGTSFEVRLIELAPDVVDRLNKKCTRRVWDKKAKQHVERVDNIRSNEEAYRAAIIECRGLTPRIVKENFGLTWPWDDPEDEVITFKSHEAMLGLLTYIGKKSRRLNRFIVEKILPDVGDAEEEEEAYNREKKIS